MKQKILASTMMIMVFFGGCIGGSDKTGEAAGSGGTGKAESIQSQVTTTIGGGGEGMTARLTNLASAISSGSGYKCTYTYEKLSAEAWVKGGRFLAKSSFEGKIQNSLSDGTWMYMWSEGERDGMKFNIKEMQELGEETKESEYAGVDEIADSALDVDCRPENIEDKTFTPPSSISFQDMGEAMKAAQMMVQGGGIQGIDDPCSVCGMIPDEESRNQCLKNC